MDTDFLVLAVEQVGEGIGLHGHTVGQALVQRSSNGHLAHLEGVARFGTDLACHGKHSGLKFLRFDHMVDQTDASGFARVDVFTGHDEFVGFSVTDESLQALGCSVARDQPEVDFGRAKHGSGAGDTNVA